MRLLTPLFPAFAALLAETTDSAYVPAEQAGTSVTLQQTEQDFSYKKGNRSHLLGIAMLFALLAAALLIVQCFRSLQATRGTSGYGISKRRLSDSWRGPRECMVSNG